MKKTVLLLLLLLSLTILITRFATSQFKEFLGARNNSGISILSVPEGARVFLDGAEVGITPLDLKDLFAKEYLVKLEKDNLSWESKVRLNSGTVTVVNRDLSSNPASQAGEVLTLEKGEGVTVISDPKEAVVEIDGKSIGKTPVFLTIDQGEHTFNISHENYLKRSIRAKVPKSYNLNIFADLSLAEINVEEISAPLINQPEEVLVKDTPTGFLRVRDEASLNGREIAQVKPGETLILLEESTGWDKVRLADGSEGFVSSDYVVKKVTNQENK